MTMLLTRGAEGLDRRAFTLDEIEAMLRAGILDPDDKFELIDGDIAPISPQNMPHMMWKSRLARWFYARLPVPSEMIPEGTLVLRERPATTFETDLLIFEPEPGAACIRPPMVKLAIEVADSSIGRDQTVKAPRYGKAGVGELWIVDIPSNVTWVHRAPGSDGYADVTAISFSEPVAPLFDGGLVIRLCEV